MIKTRIGETEFNGSYPEIMADYSVITKSMLNFLKDRMDMTEEEAEDELIEAFKKGISRKETIDKDMEEPNEPALDFLADLLTKVIVKLEKEGTEEGEK